MNTTDTLFIKIRYFIIFHTNFIKFLKFQTNFIFYFINFYLKFFFLNYDTRLKLTLIFRNKIHKYFDNLSMRPQSFINFYKDIFITPRHMTNDDFERFTTHDFATVRQFMRIAL